jgi:hypothetical protein
VLHCHARSTTCSVTQTAPPACRMCACKLAAAATTPMLLDNPSNACSLHQTHTAAPTQANLAQAYCRHANKCLLLLLLLLLPQTLALRSRCLFRAWMQRVWAASCKSSSKQERGCHGALQLLAAYIHGCCRVHICSRCCIDRQHSAMISNDSCAVVCSMLAVS